MNDSIVDFFSNMINDHIQIGCFAEDDTLQERYGKDNDKYFTDYSGRGCCLPKMWSYYGEDNTGICFIINKAKLTEAIQGSAYYMCEAPINYVRNYPSFVLYHNSIERLQKA